MKGEAMLNPYCVTPTDHFIIRRRILKLAKEMNDRELPLSKYSLAMDNALNDYNENFRGAVQTD